MIDGGWDITAVVADKDTLPEEIFVYENTGTNVLGNYVGVCDLSELKRIQVWSGQALPKFGNRFVRTSQAKIRVALTVGPSHIIDNMVSTTKALKNELIAASSTTTIYPI